MSQFECVVKDLNPSNSSENSKSNESEERARPQEPKSILSKNNQTITDVKDSLFSKITEEKNVRIILLVIIAYLITNSDQFIELLGNSFPYLVDAGSSNLTGKIVIATIIGLTVVIFTSFFQVP